MKIFLSYPRENIDIAEEIYNFLTECDIGVWFDKKALILGQDWDRERLSAQKESDQMILIYSIYTKEKSGVIQREIKDALDIIRDKPPQSQYLLPVKVGNISVPNEILRFQYIEYGDLNWKSYLISAIKTYAFKNNIALSEKFFRLEETLKSKITILSKEYNFEHSSFSARYIIYNDKSEYFSYINSKIISIIYDEYFSFIKLGDDFSEGYSLSGYRNI
jgi:hypothetical protein